MYSYVRGHLEVRRMLSTDLFRHSYALITKYSLLNYFSEWNITELEYLFIKTTAWVSRRPKETIINIVGRNTAATLVRPRGANLGATIFANQNAVRFCCHPIFVYFSTIVFVRISLSIDPSNLVLETPESHVEVLQEF